jgi:hypothetical protein
MTLSRKYPGTAGFMLLAGIAQGACSPRPPGEKAAPAHMDSTTARRDTVPSRTDTTAMRPDTANPRRDTVPTPADSTTQSSAGQGPEEIKAIYAYVKGRADQRLSPGRPEHPA